MGVRAVIVVRDDTGHHRQFWAAWGQQAVPAPHLARFIRTADEGRVPLSVAGYLAYTTMHPGTLPARDITGEGCYTDPDDVGDLDHRYELALHATERTFRYLVHHRIHLRGNGQGRPGWRRGEVLATRGQLYEAAARTCRELATITSRYAERNNAAVPPGWPTPQDWREQERIFTGWSARTDPDLLRRPGPTIELVPQWFAVRTARAQSSCISAALREQYRARACGPGSAPTPSSAWPFPPTSLPTVRQPGSPRWSAACSVNPSPSPSDHTGAPAIASTADRRHSRRSTPP